MLPKRNFGGLPRGTKISGTSVIVIVCLMASLFGLGLLLDAYGVLPGKDNPIHKF